MSRGDVEKLVADGTLRHATPDIEAAARELATAKSHVDSSRLVATAALSAAAAG